MLKESLKGFRINLLDGGCNMTCAVHCPHGGHGVIDIILGGGGGGGPDADYPDYSDVIEEQNRQRMEVKKMQDERRAEKKRKKDEKRAKKEAAAAKKREAREAARKKSGTSDTPTQPVTPAEKPKQDTSTERRTVVPQSQEPITIVIETTVVTKQETT